MNVIKSFFDGFLSVFRWLYNPSTKYDIIFFLILNISAIIVSFSIENFLFFFAFIFNSISGISTYLWNTTNLNKDKLLIIGGISSALAVILINLNIFI